MKLLTQATIVHPQMKIRRERILPKGGEVVVRVGQSVTSFQAVARTPLETDFHTIPISDKLNILPEEVEEQLLVVKGESVEIGQVLAEKKRFLGKLQVTSPVDGMFYEMNNGRIIIQRRTEWLELRAMVAGTIVTSIADRGVVIETEGCLVQGIWGSGKESIGTLKIASRTGDTALGMGHIAQAQEEQILVAGRLDRLDILEKALESKIHGMIIGSMTSELCHACTDLPFPIILTDGVGTFGMSSLIFSKLKELEGTDASLFGIYDEVRGERPEIIIPKKADKPGGSATPLYKPLTIGDKVRILRDPYAGQIGEITNIYQKSQTTLINIKSRGADVQLRDESIVFIPYNNLEIIV